MEDFVKYQRLIVIRVAVLAVGGAIALYVGLPERSELAYGLLYGGVCGLVIFRLRVLAIYRFARSPHDGAPGGFKYMAIMAGSLGLLVAVNHFAGSNILSGWTALIGIFAPNLVLMADGILRGKPPVGPVKEDAGEA